MNAAAPTREVHVRTELLTLAEPFRITGYTFTQIPVIVTRVRDDGAEGKGEASGVYYLGDDVPHMSAAVEHARAAVEAGADREQLRRLLPAGGARNALDCALWDLEAKRSGRPAWAIAGLERPRPLLTTFTIAAAEPPVMAVKARSFAVAKALKLKLTGEPPMDAERVRAVQRARPDVWLGVDANQGFVPASLAEIVPVLVECGVKLIEQPFARGKESDLEGFDAPIPIAADESVQDLAELEAHAGRFDVINIKLDKCGGLTEGLAMATLARRLGLSVMVGNMLGSSLAMAPSWLLGQLCDIVDLDGPVALARDRTPSVSYEGGLVSYPAHGWGSPQRLPAD